MCGGFLGDRWGTEGLSLQTNQFLQEDAFIFVRCRRTRNSSGKLPLCIDPARMHLSTLWNPGEQRLFSSEGAQGAPLHPRRHRRNSTQEEHTGTAHRNSTQEEHTGGAHRNSTQEEHTGTAHRNSTQEQHTGTAHRRSSDRQQREIQRPAKRNLQYDLLEVRPRNARSAPRPPESDERWQQRHLAGVGLCVAATSVWVFCNFLF